MAPVFSLSRLKVHRGVCQDRGVCEQEVQDGADSPDGLWLVSGMVGPASDRTETGTETASSEEGEGR